MWLVERKSFPPGGHIGQCLSALVKLPASPSWPVSSHHPEHMDLCQQHRLASPGQSKCEPGLEPLQFSQQCTPISCGHHFSGVFFFALAKNIGGKTFEIPTPWCHRRVRTWDPPIRFLQHGENGLFLPIERSHGCPVDLREGAHMLAFHTWCQLSSGLENLLPIITASVSRASRFCSRRNVSHKSPQRRSCDQA